MNWILNLFQTQDKLALNIFQSNIIPSELMAVNLAFDYSMGSWKNAVR